MIYDVSGHHLLSPAALALKTKSQQQFDAQVELAETVLGLEPPAVTVEPNALRLKLAVVLQVNFQLAQGLDPLFVSASSSSHTRNSVVYRDRYLDPRAVQIVAEVTGTEGLYGGKMTSHRFSRFQ